MSVALVQWMHVLDATAVTLDTGFVTDIQPNAWVCARG